MAHKDLPSKGHRTITRQKVLLVVCGISVVLFICSAFGYVPEGVLHRFSGVKLSLKLKEAVESHHITSSLAEESTTMYPLFDADFVVKTEQCQIPNFDPYDPSVKGLVKRLDPVDCSNDFPNLTYSMGYQIFVNHHIVPGLLRGRPPTRFHCCFRPFFRNQHPKNDNDNVFQAECIPLLSGATIRFEFVKVECYNSDVLVYTNFYAFVHPKMSYEQRFRHVTEAPEPRFQYSVLIVGVDAVSRLNAHRQFPDTVKVLKEMGAIEMYGYTKVGDNTFPNMVPFLAGLKEEELQHGIWNEKEPLDKLPLIWKELAAKGWATLYAEDSPTISTFNYVKRGFLAQPTDYYFRPFIYEYEKALGRRKPLNCYECVGALSETEVILNWLQLYCQQMLRRPSFAFAWINSATHDYLNGGSRVDHLYKSFFEGLHKAAYLDNTIVIFLGDHGQRWGRIRGTYIGMMEDRLPMFFIRMPPTFRRHHPDIMRNMHINSRRLVTPFDVHATLRNLVDFEGEARSLSVDGYPEQLQHPVSQRAVSLFTEVSPNRTCDDAAIDKQWCACKPTISESVNKPDVEKAAHHLVRHINSMLIKASQRCATLKVREIRTARVRVSSEEKGSLDYTVTLETVPGNAVFEATVKVFSDSRQPAVLGDVSRLNVYGSQSYCIQSAALKKFCFCIPPASTTP